jgi:hypothetical protein
MPLLTDRVDEDIQSIKAQEILETIGNMEFLLEQIKIAVEKNFRYFRY